MKRWLIMAVLVVSAMALAAVAAADPGPGKGKTKGKPHHARFTFSVTTTDGGSCGNTWANDVETRTYSVKDNGNGTFTLNRKDRGSFTTLAGQSPGACDTTGKHGKTVVAGIKGRFVGYLDGTVTASSFNPKATCAAGADCSSREGFIKTFFSAGATYSCDQNSTDCKFNFNYTAPAKQNAGLAKLKFRHWQDKGKGAGTLLKENFIGDIANT